MTLFTVDIWDLTFRSLFGFPFLVQHVVVRWVVFTLWARLAKSHVVPAQTSLTRHFANLLVALDSNAWPLIALIFVVIVSDTSIVSYAHFFLFALPFRSLTPSLTFIFCSMRFDIRRSRF